MAADVVIPFQVGATLCAEGIVFSPFMAGYDASYYDSSNGSAA